MAQNKYKIKLQRNKDGSIDNKNQNIGFMVTNYKGKRQKIYMHAYLVGIIAGFSKQVETKLNNNVIVIGNTGTGKSTLVKGMAGVQMSFNQKKLDWNNIAWGAEKFVKQYQDLNAKGETLIYDEGIDSVGALNTSKDGKKVKRTVVTGRFLLRTTYFLTDELQEFAYKMVRDCRALIRVTRRGLRRGYFEVYTDPNKILFIYNGLKFYNKNWRSPEIKAISPDCRGKFPDYSNIFFNEDEYDKKKLEEVKEGDEEPVDKEKETKMRIIKNLRDKGTEWKDIADTLGYKSASGAASFYQRNQIPSQSAPN